MVYLVKLGEVCLVKRGTTITKKQTLSGIRKTSKKPFFLRLRAKSLASEGLSLKQMNFLFEFVLSNFVLNLLNFVLNLLIFSVETGMTIRVAEALLK